MFIVLGSNVALVIDPNINEDVVQLFKENGINKVYIILTHEHYDHISGVGWFQERYDCELICNAPTATYLEKQSTRFPRLVALVLSDQDKKDGGNRYEEFKKNYKPFHVRVDTIYTPPCTFECMNLKFKATQTPGHSPGSWCLIIEDSILVTGDTLIKDTPVVVRFSESRENLYQQITIPYLQSLDPELWVLPGHFDPFKLKDNNILHTYNV
jgi:glyoxylase-like metal-dependent hydrolase (beta-lactamase superfamily II)